MDDSHFVLPLVSVDGSQIRLLLVSALNTVGVLDELSEPTGV
jgi:hypothetical protein